MNEKGMVFPMVLVLAMAMMISLTIGASITLAERKYSQEIIEYYKVKTATMLAVSYIQEHIEELDSISAQGEMTFSTVRIQIEPEEIGDQLIVHLSAVGAEGRKFPMTFVYNKETKKMMDFDNI
ncbi:competence type IV pilus minor pilin ComGG [Falsibacillus pallidus]|uniref:ComG operon protein 7 (ComGG) n=1 Tax=Falsibacillus pallidus TaxID=493781 RepID=A0A370GD93_9BACI|nr:competence type IV pilus minor pilin ComGG [Falsibacillus pallidus]RDI41166.1 ComG operon protein 7 (ComGG) [Falsibacillus pallidus]